MENMLINMNDTQLLVNINNYMGAEYKTFQDVDWGRFFSIQKPFGDITKFEVLERIVPTLRSGRRSFVFEEYLNNHTLTNFQVDRFIHIIQTKYNFNRYEEFKLPMMARLLGLLIRTQSVSIEQIDKIVDIFKDDRHGCLETVISAIAENHSNITKEVLERYAPAFSVSDWIEISKHPRLWEWYGRGLFECSVCTPYINNKNVMLNNYIPEADLMSLFFDGTFKGMKVNTKVLELTDHLYLFGYIQFNLFNLKQIINHYQGTEYEGDVVLNIIKTQQLSDNVIDLTVDFKELFERYSDSIDYYQPKKVGAGFKNWLDDMRRHISIIKCLKKCGFEIKMDALGRKYIEGYVSGFYIGKYRCDYTYELLSNKFQCILNDDDITTKLLPLSGCFTIQSEPHKTYKDKYKVMLKDIFMKEYSKSTFYSQQITKI